MDAENLFKGDITLEAITETVFANLEVKGKDAAPVKVLGLYIKTAGGNEYRYYLGGDQPLQWINSLIKVTGAQVHTSNPPQQKQ